MGRINIRRKFSLDGLDTGWSDEHYVEMNNFKFKDLAKFRKLGVKEGSEDITEENLEGILSIVKQKFVSGFIFVPDEGAEEYQLTEDVEESVTNEETGEVTKAIVTNKIVDMDGKPFLGIDGKTIPAEADDLDELPAGVVGEIVEWAMGKLSPKSRKSLSTRSITKSTSPLAPTPPITSLDSGTETSSD